MNEQPIFRQIEQAAVQTTHQLMLLALNLKQSHIYGGTVSAKEKARRRAKNKVARASRRRNR